MNVIRNHLLDREQSLSELLYSVYCANANDGHDTSANMAIETFNTVIDNGKKKWTWEYDTLTEGIPLATYIGIYRDRELILLSRAEDLSSPTDEIFRRVVLRLSRHLSSSKNKVPKIMRRMRLA